MPATVIDPNGTWRKVEERLTVESDPRLRRNLEVVLEHMRAEAVGDLDRLMATVSEAAHWHAYGSPLENSPESKPTVRRYYEGIIASGISRLEFDIDRLVVDRDCIVTEGTMRMAWPGATLAAVGIAVENESASYLYEARDGDVLDVRRSRTRPRRGHLYGVGRACRSRGPTTQIGSRPCCRVDVNIAPAHGGS